MKKSKAWSTRGMNFSKNLDFRDSITTRGTVDERKLHRRAVCLLAAVSGAIGIAPGVGHAQSVAIPSPYLDITANDYNPATGLITPNVGPSGLVITGLANGSGSAPTLATGATTNGAEAINFSGSNYFQFNTSAGARDYLLQSANITIVAYCEPNSTNTGAFVGGARGNLQYRLNGGTNDQVILAGGVTQYGTSTTGVPTSPYSAVGVTMTSSLASYYLNGATSGTAGIGSLAGFDQFGGRDATNSSSVVVAGSQEMFSGNIVELAVYNSVLTTAQIEQVQNQLATNYTSTTQLYYTGASSNSFDTTAADNFTTENGTVTQFANGTNSVVFADTLPNTQTPITASNISIQAGGVSPTAVTFNNNVVNYTLTDADGTNGINGSTGITKNYGGNLTFNGPNQFTGPANLMGGNIYLNANAAIDTASSITVGGNLYVNPGITLANPNGVNISGGSLILTSGSNLSTGSVTVTNNGTFTLNSGAIINPSIPIVLNTGGSATAALSFNQSTVTSTVSYANPVTLSSTADVFVNQGSVTLTGPVSGAGGLTVNQVGLLNLAGSATYTGATTITFGALELSGGYNPSNTAGSGNLSFPNVGAAQTLIINSTANFTGTSRIDLGVGAAQAGSLVVNPGGTLNVTSALTLADQGYAEMTVNSGGAVNLAGILCLAYPTGTATLNMLGGTLSATSPLGGITVGDKGYTGEVNLKGGTLIASSVQGNNNGVVNFNGGTLQANGSTPSLMSGLTSAFIYPGGATFNDAGYTVTVPQSLSSPTGTGLTSLNLSSPSATYSFAPIVRITGGTGVPATATAIYNSTSGLVTGFNITNPGNYTSLSGLTVNLYEGTTASYAAYNGSAINVTSQTNTGGGLNKTGSGVLILTGSNTYSGPTNVLAGTLRVSAPGPSANVGNGSFASPVVGSYTFGSTLNGNQAWTFSTDGHSGITVATAVGTGANGQGYQEDGLPPVGNQYAFLQNTGYIEQNVSLTTGDTYTLSLYTAQRDNGANQNFSIAIGGTTLASSFYPGVTWSQQTYTFTATAATELLDFQGIDTATGDNSALLNDVVINQVGGTTNTSAIPTTSQVSVASGATLDVNSSIQTIGSLTGVGNVTLGSGTLTVGGDNTSTGNFGGVMSGTGGLTKIGTGTQTLSGANTYTGATNISLGTLSLASTSSLASSSISVASGGILGIQKSGGTYTYNGLVTVAAGGGINLTDGTIGTLRLSNSSGGSTLTLGTSGSSVPVGLSFGIGNGSTGTDVIAVTGNVSALSLVDITIVPLASDTSITPGQYPLITAASGLGTSNFSLGTVTTIVAGSNGYSLSLSNSSSGTELLTITQTSGVIANAYWAGNIDGVWSSNSSGGTNWDTNASGGVSPYLPTAVSNVFFTVNSGGANLATTISSPQSINSLNFTGTAGGPVSISGSTLTIIAGASGGNVMGNGINVASGSTTVTIGSNVVLGGSQTWSSASTNPLIVNGTITAGSYSLTTVGSGPFAFNGSISTASPLAFTGSGAVGIGGNINTSSSITDSGAGPVTITGNLNSSSSLFISGSGPFAMSGNLSSPGPVAVSGGGTASFSGNISGSTPVVISGGSTVSLAGSNTFTGGVQISSGALNLNSAGALGSGTLTITGLITLDNTSGSPVNLTTSNIQVWNSDFTFNGTNSLNMGNGAVTINASRTVTLNAGTLTVGGIADGGSGYSLTTAGSGTLAIAGTSIYTGTTNVNGNSTLSFVGAGAYAGGASIYVNPGGSVNFNSTGSSSFTNFNLGGSSGTSIMTLSSGTVNVNGSNNPNFYAGFLMGSLQNVASNTILNISGGTLNVNAGGYFEAGYGGNSTINMTGGNINVNSPANNDLLLAAWSGSTVFNMSGGTVTDEGNTIEAYRGAATVNLSGTARWTTANFQGGIFDPAVLNLNGGTLITNTIGSGNAGGTFAFNMNGGTLQAMSSTTGFLPASSYMTASSLAGGANFNTAGFNVTISQAITSPSFVTGGPVSGSINKLGAGTLQLTGSNTYVGATNIKGGTLQLQPAGSVVPNYNFAIPANSGGANYAPTTTGVAWNFSADGGSAPLGAGVTNGTAFTFNGTPPGGSGQAGFIQEGGYFNQSINFPSTATYTLSFYTEQRATGNGSFEDLDVVLDNPNAGGQDIGGGFSELTAPGVTWTLETYMFTATAGSHVLTFEGYASNGDDSTAYIADVSLSGGGLLPVSTSLPSTTPVVISDNATLDLNGNLQQIGSLTGTALSSVTIEAGALVTGNDGTSTTFAGAISGTGGSVVKVGVGTQTFSGSNTYTGGTNVTGGTLVFASPGALPAFTSLTVSGGTVMAGLHNASSPKNTLFVSSLSLSGTLGAWTGTVDLTNNDMVVRNGLIGTITNQVAQGYAGGTWQGSGGILSSAAAANSTHLTALGVIQNSVDGTTTGSALYTSFDGQTVSDSDVLVKYTYYGDANLDGHVDGTDYSRIDNGYISGLTGWFNGDFNYDGVIDGSDYTLIDNAYNTQGASLASEVGASATAQISGSSAVPEPATLGLLGIGAVGLLGRRRRRSH